MILTIEDLKFLYFCTHTSLTATEINKIASLYDNIVEVINSINKKYSKIYSSCWYYYFNKKKLFF